MLRLPPPAGKNKEILLIYGQWSDLELISPLAEELNRYGGVTAPDLPGFGGMNSLYRIGQKPSLDGLADYLAAFIKLRFKRKRLTLLGVGFGLAVIVRTLQKYPEISGRVDFVVSIDGFVHHDDFMPAPMRELAAKAFYSFYSMRLPAWAAGKLFMRPFLTRYALSVTSGNNSDNSENSFDRRAELLCAGDLRTQLYISKAKQKLDLCRTQNQQSIRFYHVSLARPNLNEHVQKQHMNVVFKNTKILNVKASGSAIDLLIRNEAAALLPGVLKRQLART